MALAHRLSGIIRVATRWLRIISTNYVSYFLIFSSPAQIQWGRRSDQWGALGLLPNTFSGGRTSPPCSHSSVGVELQIFVQPAPIICRPSGASKSRLASGRQSSQSGPQSQNQSLIGFTRTRRCLLLVSNHNQTLLAGKGVILLLVVNLKIYLTHRVRPHA